MYIHIYCSYIQYMWAMFECTYVYVYVYIYRNHVCIYSTYVFIFIYDIHESGIFQEELSFRVLTAVVFFPDIFRERM